MEMPESLSAAIMEGLAFVSKVFWGPELEYCRAIHQEDGLAISMEFAFLSNAEPFNATIEKIGTFVGSYQDGEDLFQSLETEFVALFISNREGIPAPLYHSCYSGSEETGSQPLLMGEPAVEMRKRLTDVGLALAGESNELPDHLCIEIEYLYFLLSEGWTKGNEGRWAEGRRFAGEWMLPWVRRFQDRLVNVDEGGFYALVAGLLAELLTIIAGEAS